VFFPLGDDNRARATTPVVVYLLVAVNAAVWIAQLMVGPELTYAFATIPYEITRGVDLIDPQIMLIGTQEVAVPQAPGPTPIYLTLLTAMFMHGSWGHILGNMLYLWIFGDQIEDLLGHGRFLAFYVVCGVAAGFAQIAMNPESVIPCLGASGAIAGVLGAYLVRFPRNRVRVLFIRVVTQMPAMLVLGGWIVLQMVAQVGTLGSSATGVAYMAHIGGFVAGVVLILGFGRRRGGAGRARGRVRRR
jgi:membrane associated rhomboid family serine protease